MLHRVNPHLTMDVSELIEDVLKHLQEIEIQSVTDSRYVLQKESEELFHRNQALPRLREELYESPELMAMCDAVSEETEGKVTTEFCIDLVCQMAILKWADIPTIVGVMRSRMAKAHPDLDPERVSQWTADAIYLCIDRDLVDWISGRDGKPGQVTMRHEPSAQCREDLERYQHPLPMVVPPETLRHNTDTGWTHFRKGSVLLKDNHHEGDVCLDHLNRVNQIRLKLNQETARFVKNRWKGLDRQKADETKTEFQKRKRAFEKYDRNAHDLFDRLGLLTGGEFHLTHAYDFRGRTYCKGYYVTYQGNDWCKASIAFAEEEVTI